MAAQIVSALSHSGCEVRLVSRLRSRLATPDAAAMAAVEADAAREVERLVACFAPPSDGLPDLWRPDLWLTYHLYYRAPDLIGPSVSGALNIPYAALEASHAPKREHGPWSGWALAAAKAMRGADLLGAVTTRDLAGLQGMPGRTGQLTLIPPFLIVAGEVPLAHVRAANMPVRLVTAAMMRPGVKRVSYDLMAAALARLPPDGWTLTVIGDGPERAAVESALRMVCADRVTFTGQLPPDETRARLSEADIFVWPGHGEAYGMVFLEAAAAGLPVAAFASGGVGDVTRDRVTALLATDGDVPALADGLLRLIGDAALRQRLGMAGARFVRQERGLAQAASHLRRALDAMLAARQHTP